MKVFQLTGTHPASSSRESASEPRAKVVSGQHSIFTHFTKDRNCDLLEDENNEDFLQKTCWNSHAQSGTFW